MSLGLFAVFMWGRLFVIMLLHPINTFYRIVVPSLVLSAILVLVARFAKRRRHTPSDQIARNMREKATDELVEILLRYDRGQWSDAAFDAARKTLGDRLTPADKMAAFIRYRESHPEA